MARVKYLVVLSIIFSLAVTSVHLYIFSVYGAGLDKDQLTGILIGLLNEFAIGLLITSLLVFSVGNRLLNISVYIFLFLVILLKIICFHYETVFGHLPGAGILYYLSELQSLNASITVNLPPARIFLEFAFVSAIYLFASHGITVRNDGAPGYIWMVFAGSVVVSSLVIQLLPSVIPDQYFKQSREVLFWLVRSNFFNEKYGVKDIEITQNDIDRFLYLHGHTHPGPLISKSYPVCRFRTPAVNRQENKRSVIMLILEGVSYDVMTGKYSGKDLMPNLHRIAGENLSFRNIYSSGNRSSQALTSIFSGLPAQPFTMYLWTSPLLNLNGFPEILKKKNYRNVYLHGGDLAFEHQRQYLSEIGFDELIEYSLENGNNTLGWGYDDEFMFNKLREWIINNNNKPYLATLATLSTHDPYVLSRDWDPVFSDKTRVLKDTLVCCYIEGEENPRTAQAETYRYLDTQLGDFYQWYRENAGDALLVITADHPPQLDIFNRKKKSFEHEFNVPFIIAGLGQEELEKYSKFTERTGGQLDFPSTIMYLLGMQSHECDLGVNLLAPDQVWPENRYLYSTGGDSLEYLQIWHKGTGITLDRSSYELHFNNSGNTNKSGEEEIKQFLDTILSTHLYLFNNNAYGFKHKEPVTREEIVQQDAPIFVSHRGNTNGPTDTGSENSQSAIDEVIKTAFDWIEVDIRLTRDGIPVLFHDKQIEINGSMVDLVDLTFDEIISKPEYKDMVRLEDFVRDYSGHINMLIEIKDVNDIVGFTRITREVARIVNNRPAKNRIIVDSFNEYIPYSIKNYCNCETGLDLPFKKPPSDADFQHAARMNYDWIYLHYSVVNKDIIDSAHSHGLKIMAYTVNDTEVIDTWKQGGMPDGIITDSLQIRDYFNNNRNR